MNDSKKPRVSEELRETYFKDLGLNQQQQDFVIYFVFLTNMNGSEAVKMAGYKTGVERSQYPEGEAGDKEFKRFEELAYTRIAQRHISNPRIIKAIQAVKNEMKEAFIVDRLWVFNKLKRLAENGSENVQLRATELLGKALSMFTEVTTVQTTEDAASIAKGRFAERMKKEQANKVVEFKTGTENE